MLKQKYFLADIFILSAVSQPIKLSWREIEWLLLSKYVKAMRKQYNLTQVELSEKSGVGLRLVRELEQGKQTLRLDKVNQILNLFGSEIGVVPMTKTDE